MIGSLQLPTLDQSPRKSSLGATNLMPWAEGKFPDHLGRKTVCVVVGRNRFLGKGIPWIQVAYRLHNLFQVKLALNV